MHAGAQAINQQLLTRIEVHGKNLFYFFGEGDATVVLHIHFGMSGAFKTVARGDTLPEPKETTRLVLIGDDIVGQLSAMIVQHGGLGELAQCTGSTAFLKASRAMSREASMQLCIQPQAIGMLAKAGQCCICIS